MSSQRSLACLILQRARHSQERDDEKERQRRASPRFGQFSAQLTFLFSIVDGLFLDQSQLTLFHTRFLFNEKLFGTYCQRQL